MRDARPDEHGAVRVGPLPAGLLQPVAQGVAALLVEQPLLTHTIERACERGDGHVLLAEEHAEVDLAAELAEGAHHVGPAHQEGQAHARDVERLGEREELHAHVERPRRVEEGIAPLHVVDDVGIGVVVDDEQVVLAREGHDLLVEAGPRDGAHGIGGQRHDHVLGGVRDRGVDAGHIGQEVVLGVQRVVGQVGAREQARRGKDGIAGVRDQDGVARVEQGHAQVPHALLRAVAGADHIGRDARHAVAALVIGAHGVQQLGRVAQGVLPLGRVVGGLCQGVLQVAGRLEVGRAHREVVDGAALGLELQPLIVESGEDLVAEPVERARELHRNAFPCHIDRSASW